MSRLYGFCVNALRASAPLVATSTVVAQLGLQELLQLPARELVVVRDQYVLRDPFRFLRWADFRCRLHAAL